MTSPGVGSPTGTRPPAYRSVRRLLRAAPLLLLALPMACQRSSWTGPIAGATPSEALPSPHIEILRPSSGDAAGPTIEIEALGRVPPDTQVAAVLSIVDATGSRRWLATGTLRPAGEAFTGTLEVNALVSGIADLTVVVARLDDGSVVARDGISLTLPSRP